MQHRSSTSHNLGIVAVGALGVIAACGADVGDADVGGQPEPLVKQLGPGHTLVFEATDDTLSVIESAPVGSPVVLPTLEDRRPQSVLAQYFPSSKLFGELAAQHLSQPVQGQVQAISREDFLAGDKICGHRCATAPNALNPPYPYEWGESCILDAVGGLEGPELAGESFFYSVNSRSEPGVVEVQMALYPVDTELNPARRTKSIALAAGEVKHVSMTRRKSAEVSSSSVAIKVTGVTGAIYDSYACSAASVPQPPPPAPDPCPNNSCVTW